MSGASLGVLGFCAVIALIMFRMPVAIAMGMVGVFGVTFTTGWSAAGFMLGRSAFEAAFPYSLSIVPLFVAMGVFAAHAGLSRSLYNFVATLIGQVRGGMAMATIGACTIFGAVCGSGIATAATMGRVALPEMKRLDYSDSLASASVAAGGTLGVMIPPSILFVIYGLMTEQSIGKLFLSGILPGLLGMLLYLAAVRYSVGRDPKAGPAGPRHSWSERLTALASIWKVLILFIVVLGGMYVGVFSPTEAAAVGAFGALLVSWLSGTLTLTNFKSSLSETATTTGMIFMILIGAGIFNFFIETTGLTDALLDWINHLGLNRWTVMFILMLFYIVLGALMDEISMILLTVAPAFKLITSLDFDPIWFGVMLVTVCEIGMIVPPVGINLFVIQGVGNLPMATVVRGIVPFAVADGVRLFLLCL
ncbi:MAG: TRAP transporter large permease, partial [Burkholderiaceae bacterium]